MVPRNYEDAKRLDNANKSTKWQDSTNLEISQLDEHDTCINHDIGKIAPQRCKRLRTYLIYDIQYDGKHKARCVVDGHLAEKPVDSVYLGVILIPGLRLMLFLAELNK